MQDDEEALDPGGGEAETEEEKKERERIEKAIEMAAIEAKTVFNKEHMKLDYGKKRATDCKHNTCVKLPRLKSAKIEEGIEYRRMLWRRIYREFRDRQGKGTGQAEEEGEGGGNNGGEDGQVRPLQHHEY